jgi:hypothetical protein
MAVPGGPGGGVGVALPTLFKQQIGAFLGSISWVHFPGYGTQTQETRYKRAAGRRNRVLHGIARALERVSPAFSMQAGGRAAPFLDFRLRRVPHPPPPIPPKRDACHRVACPRVACHRVV